ncbi:MAG: BNR-4 repeat-containing protein [Leadbetterella sp.]
MYRVVCVCVLFTTFLCCGGNKVDSDPKPPVVVTPPDPIKYTSPQPVVTTTNKIKSSQSKDLVENTRGSSAVNNHGDTYTPLTSAKDGTIYTSWIDDNRAFVLEQIKPDGTKKRFVLKENVQQDPYHVRPAVAVDKKGFIHATADMHNQAWVYYRSKVAGSIVDGFETITPPGQLVTYPQFFKDRNDELYLTFRNKVKLPPNQWKDGSNGGGIAKYNSESGAFEMLGGVDHGLEKTVFWSSTGGTTGNNYQKPSVRLYFDHKNRMHVVCNFINEPTNGTSEVNTHIMYAYSDDGGKTFRKLDGATISKLPMDVNTASLVHYREENDIVAGAFIGADSDQNPIIGWIQSGPGRPQFARRYSGGTWIDVLPEAGAPGELYCRGNGEICILRPFQGVYISKDNGQTYNRFTFKTPPVSPQFATFDKEYYENTGNVRIQYQVNNSPQIITSTMIVN